MTVLPHLPSGVIMEPAWLQYLQRVYHQSTPPEGVQVDLNELSWFYLDAPTVGSVEVCKAGLHDLTADGNPWVGPDAGVGSGPETAIAIAGFFVRRPFPSHAELASCDTLEVSHVQYEASWSRGVTWFYHSRGSGIFLDCHNLPAGAEIEVYEDRAAFAQAIHPSRGYADDGRLRTIMAERNLKMLSFLRADWSFKWGSAAKNPRTEIVVRNADYGSTTHTACLQETGISLRTGMGGTLPCVCDSDLTVTNCNLTPLGAPVPHALRPAPSAPMPSWTSRPPSDVPRSSTQPAPPPTLPPALTCHEENSRSGFKDSMGYGCAGWVGFNCLQNSYYNDWQLRAVRAHCPICCGLPSPSPPPLSPAPSSSPLPLPLPWPPPRSPRHPPTVPLSSLPPRPLPPAPAPPMPPPGAPSPPLSLPLITPVGAFCVGAFTIAVLLLVLSSWQQGSHYHGCLRRLSSHKRVVQLDEPDGEGLREVTASGSSHHMHGRF